MVLPRPTSSARTNRAARSQRTRRAAWIWWGSGMIRAPRNAGVPSEFSCHRDMVRSIARRAKTRSGGSQARPKSRARGSSEAGASGVRAVSSTHVSRSPTRTRYRHGPDAGPSGPPATTPAASSGPSRTWIACPGCRRRRTSSGWSDSTNSRGVVCPGKRTVTRSPPVCPTTRPAPSSGRLRSRRREPMGNGMGPGAPGVDGEVPTRRQGALPRPNVQPAEPRSASGGGAQGSSDSRRQGSGRGGSRRSDAGVVRKSRAHVAGSSATMTGWSSESRAEPE
jgi:hypothetical protein